MKKYSKSQQSCSLYQIISGVESKSVAPASATKKDKSSDLSFFVRCTFLKNITNYYNTIS